MVGEPNYILTRSSADAESSRLALLEEIFDPGTRRRLSGLGIGPGSRCLEVGAGRGSIARWLGSRVLPGGHVVAADIDTRFLTGLGADVEVRTCDIRTEAPEPGTYDVVHCRALLMHLPDPVDALRRMAASVRPGGVLLAEEGDYGLLAYNGHEDAEWATKLIHRVLATLTSAQRMHAYLGRTVPGLLTDVGLEFVDGATENGIARFGDPAFAFQALTQEISGPELVAAGLMTAEEHARAAAVMSCESTVLSTVSLVAAWGRRRG